MYGIRPENIDRSSLGNQKLILKECECESRTIRSVDKIV